MTQAIQKTLRDSAAMRWTALILLALAMFCSYIFMDILSPIKDLMLSERGWDSTAFGTMQRIRVLPHLRRYHPRQDGRAIHRHPFGNRDARRCCYQMVCC